jgi:hypothetical protein
VNRPALNITAETRAAHDANRAAIDYASHSDRTLFVRRKLVDFAARFHGADPAKFLIPVDDDVRMDFAKRAAATLNDEQRLALAISLVDGLDGVDDDARNEAVDVLGGLVS